MPKIQPGGQIGPNNAGKMILRGCFMNVSQDWLEKTSGPVNVLLSDYLNNRLGEATAIKLNCGEAIPNGREKGPHPRDIEFLETVIARLKDLEKEDVELKQATTEDIFDQVTDQIIVLQQELERYATQCDEEGIEPMFTGVPGVIIENVKSRDPVTHAQSLLWEDTLDLFAGMTIHGSNESTYEPPSLFSKK